MINDKEFKFVYLPVSKIIVYLDNISYIRVYPPKEIKLEFPEIRSKIKRNKETKWKCVIYYSNSEIHINGDEALSFLELISPSVKGLKVPEVEKDEDEDNKEEK